MMALMRSSIYRHNRNVFWAILAVLLGVNIESMADDSIGPRTAGRWALAIHGGAGNLSVEPVNANIEVYEKALSHALNAGKAILEKNGSALDAVTSSVIELENNPLFNAGKGAVFTREGTHELDASIMEGATLRCGAVASVTRLKNPILAARAVMEKTPHIILGGPQADEFAASHGCETVEQSYYYTDGRFRQLQKKLEELKLPALDAPGYRVSSKAVDLQSSRLELKPMEQVGGTVGCVALDTHGNLAAATSTGGMTGKMVGRIGDSPVIGAGNYANQLVAVSGTGKGEEFLRHSVTARLAWLMETGDYSLDEAVEHCLNKVLQPGDGGLIAVDAKGNLSLQTTTGRMSRGAADSTGRFEVAVEYPNPTDR